MTKIITDEKFIQTKIITDKVFTNKVFNLSRNLKRSLELIKGRLSLWLGVIAGFHHPDQTHFVSGDLLFLICHVILQEHAIKGSCDFMARSLSQ